MGAVTNTYVDYSVLGNDYNHATFTDGAYTSATKTLVKAGAFTHNKAGHRIYLSSNDGGSIVAGLYTIATWTDADTIILATDAGAGVDDDAAKCIQHDGTAALPWNTIQGAMDLITRDAVNGDQINVVAGTAVVNYATLNITAYGTPAEGAPLLIRGCTAIANDGGIGEIDCNGAALAAATWVMSLCDLEIHNFGNNNGITTYGSIVHCEVHKGASAPAGKALITTCQTIGCYVHDSGGTGTGISNPVIAAYNYVYNCPTGIGLTSYNVAMHNIVVDCAIGITCNQDQASVIGNTVYNSLASTGVGIHGSINASYTRTIVLNNIVEGYNGAGGDGIYSIGDIGLLGYNALYSNTNPETLGDVHFDLGNDTAPAASPFTNAVGGDFSLDTTVAGAIDTAFPFTWYGPAGTANHADMGAVQNPAGAAGGISMPRVRVGH